MLKVLDTRNDVKFFMAAGEQTVVGYSEQSDLYMKLITEELIHEFLKEYDNKNLVGIADGIVDSIVVLEGFCHSLGLDLEKIWKFVNDVELLDCGNNVDSVVCDIIDDYTQLRYNYIVFRKGYDNRPIGLDKFVSNIIRQILTVSKYFNLPIQEIWDEVARSNNSKISESGKVIKNEYGKIQKPPTYSPPDIESILKKHGVI